MVFDKLFGWTKKKDADPDISFGRYSDNNKSVAKAGKWSEADDLFRSKNYLESIGAFFDYLSDDGEQNVVRTKTDEGFRFLLYQGSKVVRGEVEKDRVRAETVLAKLSGKSVPLMRRLLEMNFNLYYTRYALHNGAITMVFDTQVQNASPNKLYYGLKELATKADKQDDLLVSEFSALTPADTDHIIPMPEGEKEVRYRFLGKWVSDTLATIEALDPEKFSGAISYLLLTLVFRIDYLIAPQGKLLSELEKIASAYYTKEDRSSPDRNPAMIESFKKIAAKSRDDVFSQLFRARYTFAIVPPHNLKSVGEAIETSLQNMAWYRDNNHPALANKVMEYGLSYCQYSYSLPRPLADLFRLFMQVNYDDYFHALGFSTRYYIEERNVFDEEAITERIQAIVGYWSQKYPALTFRDKRLRFDTLLNFNQSFLQEAARLNFE